jgi:hypothetical protein
VTNELVESREDGVDVETNERGELAKVGEVWALR